MGAGIRADFPERRLSSRRRDEPVRLTRIYTRAGDAGETSLGDGSRVPKLDCRIGAFGTVDELNAALGVVLADPELPDRLREPLNRIQNDLFDVGADLSVPFGVTDRLRVDQAARGSARAALRRAQRRTCRCSRASSCPAGPRRLPDCTSRARRAAARSATRSSANEENGINPLVLAYLNRLSDFLFIAARTANADAGRDEPLWKPGG